MPATPYFPLQPRSKIPLPGSRWAQLDDPSVEFESAPDDCNRGLRLDYVTVIDCDSHGAVQWWREQGFETPVVVKTGRGAHFYYERDLRFRSGPLCEGIDVKTGPHAYVVAAGSIHPDGGRYVASTDYVGQELPQLPAQLFPETVARTETVTGRADGWAEVPAGMRNVALTSLAGTLRKQGAGEPLIRQFLLGFNRAFCEPPLEDNEVASIAHSVQRYEPEPDTVIELFDDRQGDKARMPDMFTAEELFQFEMPEIRWILPGILPEGLTILGGKPKVGKSWMSLGLAEAVAVGGSYLNAQASQGDVLYLSLEDTARRLKKRMTTLLQGRPVPKRLTFATAVERAPKGLKTIVEWAESVERPTLIIVDTLAKFRHTTKAEGYSYQDDYHALSALKAIADHYGCAVVVVHHQRKGEAEDALDTISGTTGLTGAADTILVLQRAGKLEGRGRDLEKDVCLRVKLNEDTGAWETDDSAQVEVVDEYAVFARWCWENLMPNTDAPVVADLKTMTGLSRDGLQVAMAKATLAGWWRPGKGRGVTGRFLGMGAAPKTLQNQPEVFGVSAGQKPTAVTDPYRELDTGGFSR